MRRFLAFLIVLQWSCQTETPVAESMPTQSYQAEIVGGQAESGYRPVGALALETIQGYFGGFCSSTLIDPEWVLTAAHCIDGAEEQAREMGFNLVPGHVNFVMTSNANPTRGYGRPRGATLYRAEEIYIHPNYDASSTLKDDDIALIRLVEPVSGVEPYPIFRQNISGRIGEILTYVGFGTSNPNREGFQYTGQKRRTSLPINAVGTAQYVSEHDDSGVCFGDSGGPGLITVGGQRYVAGVNSTVSGESPTCLQSSNQVRVDAYQTWIDAVMGLSPNCGSNANLCLCADACTNQGYCDNTQCGELDCAGLAQCTSQCRDGLCASRCYVRSSSDAKRGYSELADCASRRCPSGDFFCLQDNCPNEVEFCYGDDAFPSGDRSCRDIYSCLMACNDSTCVQNCYNSGTLDAQRAYSEFYSCLERRCFDLQNDYVAYNRCLAEDCGNQLTACMPDEQCNLLGGDCAGGRACTLAGWGATYCELTAGIEALSACNASQIACQDGYYCRNLGDGPRCYANCFNDSDCQSGGECKALRGASVDFGQCEVPCSDQDGDGSCDDEDCAPQDAQRFEGAEEVCGDALDGDCDGSVDEECGECTDSDSDGSCDELDCDPLNATRSPNLNDQCGDGIDNDCDNAIDENCGTQECDPQTDANCQPPIVFFDDERPANDGGCNCSIDTTRRPITYLWSMIGIFGLLGLRRRR